MRFLVIAHDRNRDRVLRRTVEAQNADHATRLVSRAGLQVERVRALDLPWWEDRRRLVPGMFCVGALGSILVSAGLSLASPDSQTSASQSSSPMRAILEMEARQQEAATLHEEARLALGRGHLAQAVSLAQEAASMGNVPAAEEARELVEMIERPVDADEVQQMLVELRDEEFASFRERGQLPATMRTGYPALDQLRERTARTELSAAHVRRARSPQLILSSLEEVGLTCSGGWGSSATGDIWSVQATGSCGQNHLRCTLSSESPEEVQSVRLEVSIRETGETEAEALRAMQDAAAIFQLSEDLAGAIGAARPWRGPSWTMTREPRGYDSYSLVLTNG